MAGIRKSTNDEPQRGCGGEGASDTAAGLSAGAATMQDIRGEVPPKTANIARAYAEHRKSTRQSVITYTGKRRDTFTCVTASLY